MARARRSHWKTAAALIAFVVVAIPILSVVAFVAFVPPPGDDFRPEAWTPAPLAPIAAAQTVEATTETIGDHSLAGPEDIAVDREGRLYTGTREGIIWRLTPDGTATQFAVVGGRPLGLHFVSDGRLIVANHGIGLQQVSPDGGVNVLTAEADGQPILFANDLDVSTGGIAYFSDSSWRYNTTTLGDQSASYLFPDMIDGRASGRVIAYDLESSETRVLLRDLYFPNGVALTADERTLWVAESNRYRILTLDLDSGSAPTVAVDNLPGTADNMHRAADGTMLLAFYDRVAVLDDWILPSRIVRQIIARLPVSLFVNEEDPLGGGVLRFDEAGNTVTALSGLSPAPTTAVEHDGWWYLGALLGQPVRQVAAPANAGR